ncbi:RIB43A-like with coiled-coils protein 1 [Spea bombifrons]|uniref:RIB43A-like with coiled-coils protein 1 n=1 Tax=Spea bombifrons TaxID=233779 RepID=UPI00234BCEE3|nr:RIB43A-like with coiled-coils protein 1 [Spea bombifrons]XP_053328936.1 RIB43A-like with coiled-coils protein 1 [Spea bombifrons]
MYKLDLPLDPKEVSAIERRRNQEKQRQSRIFNAKFRTIGVDLPTLERQVEEKRIGERTEKARDEAFDADREQYDKIALLLEQKEKEEIRKLEQTLQEFRKQRQQPESRREFDIYDPEALKKDRPARISDDDPRCGPASLQKFAGEDLSDKERQKMQAELTKKWLTEQKEERQTSELQNKYADLLYGKKSVELDERAQHLSMMEEECKKAIDMAITNFNQALTLEASERRKLQNQQEQENNFKEIYNHMTGDILTENPAVAVSAFGPHRVIPDRWKGMTAEQFKAICEKQEQQRLEKKRLAEEGRQRDAEWDKQRLLVAQAGMTLEQREQELNRELRKRMDSYNQQLSREQQAHLQYLEKEVYTNRPTAHYYTQFNATSR